MLSFNTLIKETIKVDEALLVEKDIFKPASKKDIQDRMAVVQAKNRQEFINLLTKLGVAKEDFPMFLEVIDLNSNDYMVDDLRSIINRLNRAGKVGRGVYTSKRGLPLLSELRTEFNAGNAIYMRDNPGYGDRKIFIVSKEIPNLYLEKLGFTLLGRSMNDVKPFLAEFDLGREVDPKILISTLYRKTYCGTCERAVLKGEKVFYIPSSRGSYGSSVLCLQCAEKIGKVAQDMLKAKV